MKQLNLDCIKFCYYKIKPWYEIYKTMSNFIMYNNLNETFLLFEIENDKNKLIKTFTFKDIIFNF